MRHLFVYATLFLIMLLPGCKEDSPPPESKSGNLLSATGTQTARKTVKLFDETINPVVLELPSEAIPYWRNAAQQRKPALVLFSIHPLLEPIDPELQSDVSALMANGTPEAFKRHGSTYRSEPVVLPTQALTAAISAGLFSEILWVFPSSALPEEMQLDLFRKQVTEAGFLTASEAENLSFDEGTFTGTLRGLPFRAIHPLKLPAIDKPMILHVDLGYFRGLYQGEVKTRLYDILLNTALSLNETGWTPEIVTLSYSTIEGTFSPDVRFLISNFADLLRDPTLLDGTMPEAWGLRSEALYAVNFFLEGKVQEYYEQAALKYPGDATAQYDLYRHLFFEQRKIDEALEVLDKAVSLDRGYAAAYLELAQIASDDGNLDAALNLLSRAAPVLPENPMINLYRAQFLIQSGRKDEALPLIDQLQALHWSKHYHEGVPQLLEQMRNSEVTLAPATDKEKPADEGNRKRILK